LRFFCCFGFRRKPRGVLPGKPSEEEDQDLVTDSVGDAIDDVTGNPDPDVSDTDFPTEGLGNIRDKAHEGV